MKPTFKHRTGTFEDGEIVAVTTYNHSHAGPYSNCMIAYETDDTFGTKKWFILSNHLILAGRKVENNRGYKYSWLIDTEIIKIEHTKKKHKGKWANGSFRRKLIDKNLI